MLNYEVNAKLIEPLVPRGTELDLFGGRALVSLVAFRFVNTRAFGIAWPGYTSFEEINLRFYVKRTVAGEARRGVVFIREIVPHHAIAWVARVVYNEPYRAMPMQHAITEADSRRGLRYEWRDRNGWQGAQGWTHGAAGLPVAGSEAEFITEHYWGYTRQRSGETIEYRVEHPRWKTWPVTDGGVTSNVTATYGAEFAKVLSGTPRSAFVADGSAVVVHRPVALTSE
jgi:uncharacterized protein YqjF (DUF2071 family)